jgi:nicotinamide-nucleotide adenylyltransferase
MHEQGVIHGRFQILHNDHMKYLLKGKSLCSHLIVGITSPDPLLSGYETSAPERDRPESNPLTYYQRLILVREALTGAGISCADFTIVPFPVNRPDLIRYYAPGDAVYYLSIYDDWGRSKLQRLQSLGLKTHVLRHVRPEEKGISAAAIRRRIITGEPWEDMVPEAVFRILKKWDIQKILTDASR